MVEELAEEGHPRVERCRQARVRRLVWNEERLEWRAVCAGGVNDRGAVLQHIVNGAEDAIRTGIERGRDRCRVAGGVVNDQVADGARLRVDDETRSDWIDERIGSRIDRRLQI